MKMNIKGLVFVGFAAAVFASAANAEGEAKTVTSQAYVDGKFQTLSNKLEQGNVSTNKLTVDGTNVDDTHYPTAKTVAAALAAQPGSAEYTGTSPVSVDDHVISVAEMGAASGSAAGTKGLVPASQIGDQDKVLTAGKTWATNHDTTVTTGESNGTIKVTRDGTATSVAVYGLGDAAYKALATAGVADDDTGLVTADEVHDYVTGLQLGNTYQPKSATNNYQVGNSGGTWDTMAAGTYTTLERDTTDANNPLVKYDVKATTGFTNVNGDDPTTTADNNKLPTASAVKTYVDGLDAGNEKTANKLSGGTSGNTSIAGNNNATDKYPSAKAVVDYVGNVLGNLPIPAEMPTACKTSGAHCALVTTGTGTSMTAEWTVMAQPAQ